LLDLRDRAAALDVELDVAIEVDGRAAILQRLTVLLYVLSEVLTGQHGRE
jgi:hypothetical protein